MVDALTADRHEIIEHFGRHDRDTGSPEVQVALITGRIQQLTEHLRTHPQDQHCRRGLLKLVGQRKRLLGYLRGRDPDGYRRLIGELGIRG